MKSALKLAVAAAAFATAAPIAAMAQNAIMSDDAALRAGPGAQYPRVAYVPEDARVRILGCLRDYSWCDIAWRGERGWVNASNLGYTWNNRRVVVEDWGPRIGLPVIAFSLQDYWSQHYRSRPWWRDRSTWVERDRNWRQGDRERRRDGDYRRGGSDREDWRDRQRSGREDWRNRQRGDESAREREDGRSEDAQRFQDRQGGRLDRGDDRMNHDRWRRGEAGAQRNRDNIPEGRGSERRQGVGGDRM